jgi:hypothetical protein
MACLSKSVGVACKTLNIAGHSGTRGSNPNQKRTSGKIATLLMSRPSYPRRAKHSGSLFDFGKLASGYFAPPILHLTSLSAWGLSARKATRHSKHQLFNFSQQEGVSDEGGAQRTTNVIVASRDSLSHLTLQNFGGLYLS